MKYHSWELLYHVTNENGFLGLEIYYFKIVTNLWKELDGKVGTEQTSILARQLVVNDTLANVLYITNLTHFATSFKVSYFIIVTKEQGITKLY